MNEWGYHGFHVTWANENGITSELQLTTPEAWKLKIWSDGIYDKWRNRSENEMTDAEYKQYLSDVEESQKRWGKLWNQMDDPDLSLYERSSFSESTRPSQMSSTVTGDVGTVQVPFTNSLRQGLEGNLSTTRPSLSNVAISNTSQENNINVNNDINIINQRGGKSNLKTAMSSMPGADKIDKASVKAFEDAYDGSIDADTYAQGMTWGYIAGYYGMPEETALSRNEAFASLPASLQAQAHYAGHNYANNIPEGIERRLDELKDAQARARDAKTIDSYEEQIEALENRLEELSGSVRETSRYEAKQRYAEKRNAENAQIETLTEEQHEALADLAKIRHEIHSNWESIWSGNDDNLLDNVDEINNALEMAGLPQIETPDVTMLPLADDYYEVLSNSEREEWEARAEEEGYNSGIEAWRELSGEYDEFAQTLSEINDKIESYLSNIDKEHGTQYAPTGWARLKEDNSYSARTGESFAREFSGEVDTDGWHVPVKRISSAIMQGYSHIDKYGVTGHVYTADYKTIFRIMDNGKIKVIDVCDLNDIKQEEVTDNEYGTNDERISEKTSLGKTGEGRHIGHTSTDELSGASGSDDSVAGRESSGNGNGDFQYGSKPQRNGGQVGEKEDNQNRLSQKYSTDDLSNTVRDHQLTLDEYAKSIDSPKAKAERKQIAQALSELGTAASKIGKSDNVRTVALGIVDDFVEKGAVDYESVRLDTKNPEISASQVAAYGMLLRDPRFETFRILFTKGDRIISVQSFTSRLVDRVYITKKMLDEIITKRNGLKADGYYIMHNHPSGDPSASNGDINTTRRFSKMIPGFKGHIIVDHNKYSYLNASGYTQGGIQTLANGKAETFEKRIVDHPLLFDKLNDPSRLAQAAIDLVHSKDVGVLAYCDAKGSLRAIEEVKNAFMKSTDAFEKYLADRKVQLGSPMAFLLVSDGVTFDDAAYDLQHLFLHNLVFDIVDQSGRSMYMGDSGLTVNIGGKIEDINGTARDRMGYNPDGTIGEKAFEVKEDTDREYLELAKNPKANAAKLSKMVERRARAAGYDSPLLYHGTKSFGFTEFDLSKMDDKTSIFTTTNSKMASTYSGAKEMDVASAKPLSEEDVEKMSPVEITNKLNKLTKSRLFEDYDISLDLTYRHYSVNDLKRLSESINTRIRGFENKIDSLIKSYADKMAADSNDGDAKTHKQLVSIKEMIDKNDINKLSTPVWLLLNNTDVFGNDAEKIKRFEKDLRIRETLENFFYLGSEDTSKGIIIEEGLGGYSIELLRNADAQKKLIELSRSGNYSLYGKTENMLTVDAKGATWNAIEFSPEKILADDTKLIIENEYAKLLSKKTGEELSAMALNEHSKNLNKETIQGILLNKANNIAAMRFDGSKHNTREISAYAKSKGYNGVIIENVMDDGGRGYTDNPGSGDLYIYFDTSDLKSADPVTYDENGEVIPLSERFNPDKADILYEESNYDTTKEKYSYEKLVSKPDMSLTIVPDTSANKRGEIVQNAKKNVLSQKIGTVDEKNRAIVHVDDNGRDVVLASEGIRHGMAKQIGEYGSVYEHIGSIIKNSIQINELNPRGDSINKTYVLIGAAKDNAGNVYIVRSVINNFTSEVEDLDVLYASKAKKEPAARNVPGLFNSLTGSKIKISDLLDYVNKYFPDILPESVLKHYGYTKRPEGELGKSALYEETNYFLDTNDAAPDQELIDTKRQLNDALRELKKQTERAEYFKGQTRLTKQRRVTDRAVRDITKKYADQVDTARLSKEEIAADITELANKTLNVPEEYTISSFREFALSCG